jgi:hypothetical protein
VTTLARIPAGLDLAATVGADLVVAVTVNENDAPYDFTSNTIETAIFNQDGTTNASNFTTSTLNNVLTLTLSDTATAALGADSFTWELRVTKDSTTIPWLAGTLSVVPRGAGGSSLTSTTLTVNTALSVTLNLAVGFGVIPDAEAVPFTASDPLTETNVQDALDELATAVAPRIPTVKSSVFIEDNAVATVVTQNVAAKVLGTFLAGPACMACEVDGNRITYIGTRNTRVLAVASVDVDGPNNQTYTIELRRNGQLVDGLRSKVRKGTQVASGSIVGHIPLVTNDYIELWITNTTSGDDPVVSDATFALMN